MLILIFASFSLFWSTIVLYFAIVVLTLEQDLGVIGYSASYKGVLVVGLVPISEALASSNLGDGGI